MEPNLIHFKWGSRVNRQSLTYFQTRRVYNLFNGGQCGVDAVHPFWRRCSPSSFGGQPCRLPSSIFYSMPSIILAGNVCFGSKFGKVHLAQ